MIIETLSESEAATFAAQINGILEEYGTVLQDYLPLTANDFFEKLQDGLVLSYLLHHLSPGCIEIARLVRGIKLSELNMPQSKAIFEITANLNLVIAAAKSIKQIVVINIGAHDIIEKNADLVLGLLWQIIRAHCLSKVSIIHHAELVRLLNPGENFGNFVALKAEAILLRWLNFHLERSGYARRISNFANDLCDSECLALVLQQVYPSIGQSIVMDIINTQEFSAGSGTNLERAQKLFKLLETLGIETKAFKPEYLASGHPKMNLLLVAKLFNTNLGIHLPSEDEARQLIGKVDNMFNENQKLNSQLETLKLTIEEYKHAQTVQSTLKEQLEKLQIDKDRELEQVQCEFQSYRNELLSQYEAKLNQMLCSERQKHDEEKKRYGKRESDLIAQMQIAITLMVQEIGQEGLEDEKIGNVLNTKQEDSIDAQALGRGLMIMTKGLIKRLRQHEDLVLSLRNDLTMKQHVSDLMGIKVREYTENLIQTKKGHSVVAVESSSTSSSSSPLSKLKRILSKRTTNE